MDWALYDRADDTPGQLAAIAAQCLRCREAGVPGVALVAAGRA